MTTPVAAHSALGRKASSSVIVAVLSLSGTVVALQQTLVVPLLPEVPKLLDTTPDNASWLVTATLLTSAVATPIVSRLADMVGKRLMMIVCLVVMIAGSVVAALSHSLGVVIAGRAMQGFAAALIPVGISIMRDELPREKVGGAVALMSATLGIGAAIGLPLAGVIYAHADWHALFWVAAALGAALLVAVPLVVPESSVRTRGRFDVVGALLLSGALGSLLLAVSKGSHWGWASEPTIVLFVVAALLLAVWTPYELRVSQPMVDLRTSARRPVLLTNIASVLIGFSMYGNLLSTTQLLQMPEVTGYGFGLSVVDAGLCMLPSGLMMVLFAPVSAAITHRHGAKLTLITGAALLAVGYVGRVFLLSELWQIVVGAALVSMGTAVAYAAMPTLIMRAVPITETASANGLNTLLRAIGTSTASAAVAALLTGYVMRIGGVELPALGAFKGIFWLCAIAALLSAAVALGLPRRVAAPVPVPVGEPVEIGARTAAVAVTEDIKPQGGEHEIVVRGVVTRPDLRPIRGAVVSVLRIEGEPVDWSRADNDGAYSVVLPGPGRYVVVSSADGWAPRSAVVELVDDTTHQQIRLTDRVLLSGVVTERGQPVDQALVSLTRPTGEAVVSHHTDSQGRYEMPLPPTGRYILTVVNPLRDSATSRQIIVAAESKAIDVELTSPAPALT